MAEHRFTVGQLVRMKGQYGLQRADGAVYLITATLPARDNSPQYRVRSESERHDRVVTEDSLEGVEASPASVDRREL